MTHTHAQKETSRLSSLLPGRTEGHKDCAKKSFRRRTKENVVFPPSQVVGAKRLLFSSLPPGGNKERKKEFFLEQLFHSFFAVQRKLNYAQMKKRGKSFHCLGERKL